jgi:hypothetical protein
VSVPVALSYVLDDLAKSVHPVPGERNEFVLRSATKDLSDRRN